MRRAVRWGEGEGGGVDVHPSKVSVIHSPMLSTISTSESFIVKLIYSSGGEGRRGRGRGGGEEREKGRGGEIPLAIEILSPTSNGFTVLQIN